MQKGRDKNPTWYGYSADGSISKMEEVVGVPLKDATFQDFQRIFKCMNKKQSGKDKKCKGLGFPTTCSKQPCDTCPNGK